ncbi:MAG TPA: histone deacetylase, partial [Desulfobacteraceae bacterium]|nr:histone deacetylase [Desulfobacteraceae bacterium]
PETLFISLHQDGRTLYPGSGFPDEAGGPNAPGRTVNIPLPPGTGEEGFLHTLEELVMPLLERFEPEIIINSAGQDNHFSDPITNMNFSARGYAALNSRLKPDIAVLEGGYAVETALPYTNVGIIMAMAGMDTSHVKEPDYDKQCRPQSPETTAYLHQLIRQLKQIYFESWNVEDDNPEGRIIERSREIFYDTDMIRERQKERLRRCRRCAGTLAIESASSLGSSIMGVSIPKNACPACSRTGRQWFEEAAKGRFDHVYLQDRDRGAYETI